MRMVREMDAGPVLYRVAVDLPSDITAGELYEMLSEIGATALVEALAQLEAGVLEEEPQVDDRATYAPKMSRATARLDWRLTALELDRWVRGCDPWPGAWSELEGVAVQLFESVPLEDDPAAPPGTIVRADQRTGLVVAAGTGSVRLGQVKPAGRSRMAAQDWIRGRGVEEGQRFE
jgi:methionyl-tRNA formyltransferase